MPHRFYAPFAAFLADAGYSVVTYDFRGIASSAPPTLRGFSATLTDWALLDMAGVLDWAADRWDRMFLIGHSFGGQAAGLLDNTSQVVAMATFAAQSGHWRLQGGEQKYVVAAHVYLTLPILSRLFGYAPWSRLRAGEDLPKGVALQWARWSRHPDYLLGDTTLPLERFATFRAPVLAYSFADDKWGTRRAVDTMMAAYPSVERRHIEPADIGSARIGHMGAFRPAARRLWEMTVEWLEDPASAQEQ